jgi:hypothetical protein
MADFSAEQLAPDDLGFLEALAASSPAGQLAPDDLGYLQAAAVSIPAEELFTPSTGAAAARHFEMRGIDSGTLLYTTWVVTGAPDPNGAQATAANTTPALVGAIVASSGLVISSWC